MALLRDSDNYPVPGQWVEEISTGEHWVIGDVRGGDAGGTEVVLSGRKLAGSDIRVEVTVPVEQFDQFFKG